MANAMHGAGFSQSHNVSRQSLSAESYAGNTSFADDSQMLDRDGNEDADSFSEAFRRQSQARVEDKRE